jgi:hypothetical protein
VPASAAVTVLRNDLDERMISFSVSTRRKNTSPQPRPCVRRDRFSGENALQWRRVGEQDLENCHGAKACGKVRIGKVRPERQRGFIGPFIATVFPTLLAMAQFHSWQALLAVFIRLNVSQFVVGSYVEPRVSGNVLAISPWVVLFATFLRTYLWGLLGTFIGVPMAHAALSFCDEHRSGRWIADLLGKPSPARTVKLQLLDSVWICSGDFHAFG